jgi:hypothetical protein
LVTFEQEQQKLEPYGVVWVNSDPLGLLEGRLPLTSPAAITGQRSCQRAGAGKMMSHLNRKDRLRRPA